MKFFRDLFDGRGKAPTEPAPAVRAHERVITPFFANLRGYVGIAEKLPLVDLPEFMNAYFSACTEAIQATGGTLDKYVGDCVVAMFGAIEPQPDQAFRACSAALDAQKRLAVLRAQLAASPDRWPDCVRQFRVSIGLHTGLAIVGNVGSRTRFNYTMMGDNVNLAARLESAAKAFGVRVVCSETTQGASEATHPGRILFRSLGRIAVKGRKDPLGIFEPVALHEDVTDEMSACVRTFHEGLERYRARDWMMALECFRKSGELEPGQPGRDAGVASNPSLVFAELAREFQANPAPSEPGVFVIV